MNKKYVLITGITGFLGSHIAENLLNNNIPVIGLKRKNSNIWRCQTFKDKIIWIDLDEEEEYIYEILKYNIDIIIHGAWIGVEAHERDDWNLQTKNIHFLVKLLQIAKKLSLKKFIFLGSQAEYGTIVGIVNEEQKCEALNAYGSVKLACLELVKTFSKINNINWIWLRLFSLFGEKENETWLIPSLIQKIKNESQMDFTLGEQQYAYLYVKDFTSIINKIIVSQIVSGIYNISSDNVSSIRLIVEKIRNKINPEFKLNFGALSYRENQSMHMQGSIDKLKTQVGNIEFTDFSIAIGNTINYYNI
jgi:nucleoside-diphosphate-sugar epimerase